jgi:hypothetical protein
VLTNRALQVPPSGSAPGGSAPAARIAAAVRPAVLNQEASKVTLNKVLGMEGSEKKIRKKILAFLPDIG